METLSRILLGLSAIILAIGAHVHTSAFHKTVAAVNESNLPVFLGNGLKVLWLQDSVIANLLAIIFAVVAIKPTAAPRWIGIGSGAADHGRVGLSFHRQLYRRSHLSHGRGGSDPWRAPRQVSGASLLIDNLAADDSHLATRLENFRLGNFHDVARENSEIGELAGFD